MVLLGRMDAVTDRRRARDDMGARADAQEYHHLPLARLLEMYQLYKALQKRLLLGRCMHTLPLMVVGTLGRRRPRHPRPRIALHLRLLGPADRHLRDHS